MRLLVLGGTVFLGRHVVEAALARGHAVTLFNRGHTNPDLFPEAERLRGDRGGDLAVLRGREWDVVIDTARENPAHVRDAAGLLAGAVGHYTFVSSISAYADFSRPGVSEDSPLAEPPAEGEPHYGQLKVMCEREAERAMPGRVLIVRPGLIVGPHDPTDRFTYWPRRVARGGEVLAPGRPERSVQFIDARDLAGWLLDLAERRHTGVLNATGPASPLSMGELLAACKTVAGSDAAFVWVSDEFLAEHAIGAFSEMPLWVPPEMPGFLTVDLARPLAAGLSFRPLADTIRDTLTWDVARDPAIPLKAGLAPDREQLLLGAWYRA